MVDLFNVSDLAEELLLLLPLVYLVHLGLPGVFPHLLKVLFEQLVIRQLLVVVDLLAEADDLLQWIRAFIESLVSYVTHALESAFAQLRIWVGHMEADGVELALLGVHLCEV